MEKSWLKVFKVDGFVLENLLKNWINQLMPSNLDNNWYNCPRTLRVLGAIYQLLSSFEGINSNV